MRRSRIARSVVAAAATFVVWLAGDLAADASPLPRPRPQRQLHRTSQRVCDARLSPRRAVTRAGRISAAGRRLIRRYNLPVHLLQRMRVKGLTDDDAAIQNGAVVGWHNPRLLTVFEPIGVLSAPSCPLLSHRPVSRRSPRGPPILSA